MVYNGVISELRGYEVKIWFDDKYDNNARARDFMRFSQVLLTNKSDVTGYLFDILGKCSRHPEYYQACKTTLIDYAKTNEDVRNSLKLILNDANDHPNIIKLANEIMASANNAEKCIGTTSELTSKYKSKL